MSPSAVAGEARSTGERVSHHRRVRSACHALEIVGVALMEAEAEVGRKK